MLQYPEFERDLQRKDLESEGRDYLRANRGALAQAGVEFARNNPDLARKVIIDSNEQVYPNKNTFPQVDVVCPT